MVNWSQPLFAIIHKGVMAFLFLNRSPINPCSLVLRERRVL
jgi:hypothetical protein